MASNKLDGQDYLHGLGANERALLERLPLLFMRKIAAAAVRLKMQLQFTGWLQYILPLNIVVILTVIGGISLLLNIRVIALPFLTAGAIILAIALFDLITVKFKLRFRERLPKRKDNLDLFDLMRSRRSCRSFQTRKLTQKDHEALMASVTRHTSEAKLGTAPVRFEYISAPITVWPIVNASEFLVAIAPKQYSRLAVIDVGRTLQKVVLDATRMGLGTCWIGPGADHNSILNHLGDRFNTNRDHIICVCAIGYRSKYIPLFLRIFNAMFKRRLSLTELFFADDGFERPLDLNSAPFNNFGRNYEICQWAPSSYNGQTTRCVGTTGEGGEIKSFDFYTTTGSRYYAPVALGIWCANWELGCAELGLAGRFVVPSADQQYESNQNATFPRYDLSWVPASS